MTAAAAAVAAMVLCLQTISYTKIYLHPNEWRKSIGFSFEQQNFRAEHTFGAILCMLTVHRLNSSHILSLSKPELTLSFLEPNWTSHSGDKSIFKNPIRQFFHEFWSFSLGDHALNKTSKLISQKAMPTVRKSLYYKCISLRSFFNTQYFSLYNHAFEIR